MAGPEAEVGIVKINKTSYAGSSAAMPFGRGVIGTGASVATRDRDVQLPAAARTTAPSSTVFTTSDATGVAGIRSWSPPV